VTFAAPVTDAVCAFMSVVQSPGTLPPTGWAQRREAAAPLDARYRRPPPVARRSCRPAVAAAATAVLPG